MGEKKSNPEAKYKVIIFILLVTCGVLSWQVLMKTGEYHTIQVEKTTLETDRENLRNELTAMLSNYDSLDATNEEMTLEMNEQKTRIRQMLLEIDQHRDDDYIIMKLRKESESLRDIMKGFVHTIDSLNTLNITLRQEKTQMKAELGELTEAKEGLEEANEDLSDLLEFGSILQAGELKAIGLRLKSSGKQVETDRAARSGMIKTCFIVMGNRIAQAGDKEAFIRVVGPDGAVLTNAQTENKLLATKDEGRVQFSCKRSFSYQNTDVRMCVFYTIGKEMVAGAYKAEVYVDGYKIGTDEFTLR